MESLPTLFAGNYFNAFGTFSNETLILLSLTAIGAQMRPKSYKNKLLSQRNCRCYLGHGNGHCNSYNNQLQATKQGETEN